MERATAPTHSPPSPRLQRAGDVAARIGSLRPEDPNLRRAVYIGIAVVLLLSVALAATASLNELPDVEWRFRPFWIVVGVGAMFALLIVDSQIWRWLLRSLGPDVGFKPAIAIWNTSGLGRYVPASVLLPVLRVAMAEREGVPKRICLASIVYETALAFTGSLFIAAYFVIDLPDLQGEPTRFAVLAIPVIALVAMQPRIFHPLADYALRQLGRAPLPAVLSGAQTIGFALVYALTVVLAGISLYGIGQCVFPIPGSDLVTVIGAFAVGTTFGLVALLLPGGLVAREAGVAVALSPVMPTAPAVAIAVLARILQMALELLIAAFSSVLLGRRVLADGEDTTAEELP